MNDNIWELRGGAYREKAAIPFRTIRLKKARQLAALGLYAVTFYNDRDLDVATLNAYRDFRHRATQVGMAHFLEVFNPAINIKTYKEEIGTFINDSIVRCLAGVSSDERPLFLKVQYNGARTMTELASYDPGNLIVGVGVDGTTHSTDRTVWPRSLPQNLLTEDPAEIVRPCVPLFRDIGTVDAVKLYHDTPPPNCPDETTK